MLYCENNLSAEVFEVCLLTLILTGGLFAQQTLATIPPPTRTIVGLQLANADLSSIIIMSSGTIGPFPVMSRDGLDILTLTEIAEACQISPNQIDDVYSCTPMQKRIMGESAIRPNANIYQYVFSFGSSFDIDRFCAALRLVVSRNSILRTRLVDCSLGLVQVVTSEEHLTERHHEGRDRYMVGGLGAPLCRSVIVDRTLVVSMHHAIMDNWSMSSLLREILGICFGNGPEMRSSFKEFTAHCLGIDEYTAKSFWASRFKGAPAIFPKVERGYTPNATQKVTTKITSNHIGNKVSLVHLPSFIETAWALTAGVYTSSESVAFGLVLSGRTSVLGGVETALGPTIVVIPIQINLQSNKLVGEIIKERTISRRQLQTHPALQYDMAKIRNINDSARIASSFQTVINILPPFPVVEEIMDVRLEFINPKNKTFGIVLNCIPQNDGILVEALSDPAVCCELQLRRIVRQFGHALEAVMEANSQAKLSQLELLNDLDRLEIFRWNNTVPDAVEQCIHELFSAQARAQPEASAVEAWDGNISYGELDKISWRLALELRRRGVENGSTVPFIFEKSLWTIVACIAIMKAGGACVPIDKSHPMARKANILASAHAKIVLTSSAEFANSMDLAPDVFAVSTATIFDLPDVNDSLDSGGYSPSQLAYIMFTSGSTGNPKGVMLEHRSLASALTSLAHQFSWRPGRRILQFAAHTWDASIVEIFGALLFGGCLCIPSEEARQSSLAEWVVSSKVNWAFFTPTVLRTLSPDDVSSLHSVVSGGEPVGADSAKTWGRAVRFINAWGTVETSLINSTAVLTPTSHHPENIGKPVGCAIWIVKPGSPSQLCPIGAVGEVLVEGPGVARGYLDDPATTAASFIKPPPWAPTRENKSTHFYRTGDLAKYHPDGSICFVGRQDSQVKIRGQRFEIGEVESVIRSCLEAKDVFATTRILKGRTELVAVVCLADPKPQAAVFEEPSDSELTTRHIRTIRRNVRSKLPSYMVPTIWLAVGQMPQGASGKLDRPAIGAWLKTRDLSSARAAPDEEPATLTSPSTKEERLLQSVWSSVLSIPGRDIWRESSFVQLGGDSVLAMQVASRCRKYGMRITTADLLRDVSLAAIATESPLLIRIPGSTETTSSDTVPEAIYPLEPAGPISKVLKSQLANLSRLHAHFQIGNIESVAIATDAQASMLAVAQLGEKVFRAEVDLAFAPALDAIRLRKACHKVIRHHPLLRTLFFQHGPALYQAVLKDLPMETVIEIEEGNSDPPIATLREDTILARFHLFSDGQFCHRLRLDIHHVVYDAFSLGLLLQDLESAYACNTLLHETHFHSWVSHVEGLDKSGPLEHWKEVLQDSSMSYLTRTPRIVTLGYPLDERFEVRVPLQNLQSSYGTPSSTMKAAWAVLMFLALGDNDVMFGEISYNRYLPLSRLEEVRGPCVNALPVRAILDRGMTFASLVKQIHDLSIASFPFHHLGLRSIIKDCTTWPCWSRFNSMLVYHSHQPVKPSLRVGGANCTCSLRGEPPYNADIFITATPELKELEIELRYSSRTLPPQQIRWISQSFTAILEGIPSLLNQTLSQIEDSLRGAFGSYTLPPRDPDPPMGFLDDEPRLPPSHLGREVVLKAWRELELLSGDQSEDCSMFTCGADVVTSLLLSKYYTYRGYNISTMDIIQHPTRSMQAYLIDQKRAELETQYDTAMI
ncbi:NRPS [Emmonsiellopsis sp. PD_33]|nr:NRPS [Emmonsiellopsis sp. PD_33]